VEHISFHGTTGDTTQLVQLLTQSYQFQPIESFPGEKLYQVRSGDSIYSELRLQPQAVLRSDAPQQSIAVELEFARPGSERTLPPHGPTLQISQVPGSPVAGNSPATADSSSGLGASVNSAASNYFQQIRYATPAETSPLMSKRWPQ
ncbi:MAG TPA: DUF6690 family protein, partial [Lacipirellulaceae bacterium]|nr:DUF6690 family protein [Lacipirellulaceae bacterium]